MVNETVGQVSGNGVYRDLWHRMERMKTAKTAAEIADLIERFLNNTSRYPQEWNDFVERRHPDKKLDSYRRRCDELDPLVNCPDPQDAKALAELKGIVE